VRVVLQECETLYKKIVEIRSNTQTDSQKVSQYYHSICITRNKKYLERYVFRLYIVYCIYLTHWK